MFLQLTTLGQQHSLVGSIHSGTVIGQPYPQFYSIHSRASDISLKEYNRYWDKLGN